MHILSSLEYYQKDSMHRYDVGQRHKPTTRDEIESLQDLITINNIITIILDNDAYESVCYTFEAEVLCYYNDYLFLHSNADIKHLSGDNLMY